MTGRTRYPRTLTEAFNDAERASAVSGPYRGDDDHDLVDLLILLIGLGTLAAVVLGAAGYIDFGGIRCC